MRLFFALEPNRENAVDIANWRDRQFPGAGRPVPMANLHITLAFLGEISHQRLEQLCLAVDDYLRRHPAGDFTLELDQLGYWPKPQILWLGPSHWPDALNQLAAGLAQLGTALGARRKRGAFQPHITLLRGCELAPAAPAAPPLFSQQYSDFALLESRQGRNGVSYHPLANWALL
jgi:2'-5' RNA ligase